MPCAVERARRAGRRSERPRLGHDRLRGCAGARREAERGAEPRPRRRRPRRSRRRMRRGSRRRPPRAGAPRWATFASPARPPPGRPSIPCAPRSPISSPTREGPALRPGSRSYARAWIRDGAMMSTALLRMGLDRPAIDFLEYYAPFQYPNGKVPCCVDARGADPVPEHDSHGELIHLVAQVHRYAPDMARLQRLWPRVRAAADHIETLRQSTRIPANRRRAQPPALRPAAAVDQPRRLFGPPGLFLLGRFLGADRAAGRRRLAAALGRTEEARAARRPRAGVPRATSSPRWRRRARSMASASSPAPPTSAISTRPRPRSRSAPAGLQQVAARRRARRHLRALLGANSLQRRDGGAAVGRLHAL